MSDFQDTAAEAAAFDSLPDAPGAEATPWMLEIDVLTAERDQLASAKDQAEAALAEAQAQLATVTAERDALQAAVDKAAAAPKVSRSSGAAKARKAGPLQNPGASDLLDAIAAADAVEVVFSDGRFELLQIPGLVVSGAAWAKVIGGVALRVPELLVHGPAVGTNSWPLAGYGLFLDGKQAAWAPRSDTLLIGGGMQVNLRDDVIFPAE